MARQNYARRTKTAPTKWDSLAGQRLLESFSFAAKGGFMKEFLDDLLTEHEFKKLASKLFVLELLFAGTPYSYMNETYGLSSRTISAISKKTANKKGGYYRIMRSKYPYGYKYFD